ncbi:Y-family DNA polymerase [uncultured Shewanella sp.]|uniref:Y-family DNA polymerase n=1 Tax=uncultured Shewanella sp. TaxID=173975 RepID=UPI002635FF40|nr:Y-family DNA polymerase [uncultured Shewanella sp.]
MFALVDANSFYCSAEQVFRPDWRGKPLVVLSNNDGCIVAANRQAKALGVKKFVPYFQVKALCEKRGVIALSSNYALYGDLSMKMMQIIGRFAPEQYIYSIDESFLSFKGAAAGEGGSVAFMDIGQRIRRAVWKEARLPVSVGMGATLTLAKLAAHIAKTVPEYQGVCVIDTEGKRLDMLRRVSVGDVWGVGRKLMKKLARLNVHSAYDLSGLPYELTYKSSSKNLGHGFNIEVSRTIAELNGEPVKEWDRVHVDKKQIFSTRSLGERMTDNKEALCQALCLHVDIAAVKMRQQQSGCLQLLLFAMSSPHDTHARAFKVLHTFERPVSSSLELCRAVKQLVSRLYHKGIRYYKVGVGLMDLVSCHHQQLDMFSPLLEHPNLMPVYDKLNRRFGRGTVFVAAEGTSKSRADWTMRRTYLTPQYTTQWHCLPKINC